MKLQVGRIKILQRVIQDEPEHYEQGLWGARMDSEAVRVMFLGGSRAKLEAEHKHLEFDRPKAICNTVCCIAGTTLAIFDTPLYELITSDNQIEFQDLNQRIISRAQVLLGLTDRQATLLFAPPNNWPIEYFEKYRDAKSLAKRAEVGISILQDLIDDPIAFEKKVGYTTNRFFPRRTSEGIR